MKTRVKTFITICVVAYSGIITANASVRILGNDGCKDVKQPEVAECLSTQPNEMSVTTEGTFEVRNNDVDYQREAQLIMRSIADMAEAKANQKIMNQNLSMSVASNDSFEVAFEVVDFRQEALRIEKLVADEAEARAIHKLFGEGRVFPIR